MTARIQRFVTYTFLGVSGFLLWRGDITRFAMRETSDVAAIGAASADAAILDPNAVYGPPKEISGSLRRGDRLRGVLVSAGIEPPLVDMILGSLVSVFDPTRARPGDTFSVTVDPDQSLLAFQYDRTTGETYRVEPSNEEGAALEAYEFVEPVESRLVKRVGTIENSLHESVRRVGGSAEEVELFANVFNGAFDFFSDSRKGDDFEYVMEAEFTGDTMKRPVRLLSAHYTSKGRGKTLSGYYYEPAGASKGSYYAADGTALARRFLKCPLPFTRISSRFSSNRLHPVLGIRRPHLGVDFAAPTGTPVAVVADGVVRSVGRDGGLGNAIKVKHASGIETVYGHLSRYAKGLKSGMRVEQGQVIGYVGSTGLSSGPHLHYSTVRNGVHVDPLKFDAGGGPSLPAPELATFAIARERMNELRVALPVGEPQPTAFASRDVMPPVTVVAQRS
jgi:murein DD-endopeptidase MepM/ murein hydrolase activator NlpD